MCNIDKSNHKRDKKMMSREDVIRTKTRWSSTGRLKIRTYPKPRAIRRTYTSPDGTPVSIKDMDLLIKLNKSKPTEWLKGYLRWKKQNKERSDTMAKKKAKKAKKKVSPLDKIRKQMDKLEALNEKVSDMIFDIQEIIDDAQMDDDTSYNLD